MRQEDYTNALVQMKRIGTLLDEMMDLTRQLAESIDRGDQVSTRLLIAMRQEPVEKLQNADRLLREQLAALALPDQQILRGLLNQQDGEPDNQMEEMILRQSAYNRRQHAKILQIDEVINRKIGREKSVYAARPPQTAKP